MSSCQIPARAHNTNGERFIIYCRWLQMDPLQKQYFAMVPVKEIQWQEVIKDWKFFSTEDQEKMLLCTILHPKSMKFPVTISYNRKFVKYVISMCESAGSEIIDELYEIYTHLVALPDVNEGEYCFKTYFLNDCTGLSIAESRSLISHGTTGLQTWQAAKFLAEWVIQHQDCFRDRHVLELGSGLGLLGLVTCHSCDPKTFNFTDCHDSVLQLLAHNLEINNKCQVSENQECDLKTNMRHFQDSLTKAINKDKELTDALEHLDLDEKLWSPSSESLQSWKNRQDPRIVLTKLDWEKNSEEELSEAFANVDITLASDVVFDVRIIPALVKVMCILTRKSGSIIYIASTVRNTATRDTFLQILDEMNLKHELINDNPQPVFFYDKSVPIELLKITS